MTGSEILSLPVGCERLLVSSDSASWICSRILWQRVRNAAPSAVRLTFLVLRLNSQIQFMLKPGDILTHRRGRYAQQPGGLNKA